MSLTAESPVHSSSSSDDFAALIDAELDAISFGSSPDVSDADEDDKGNELEEPSSKRLKVEGSGDKGVLHESVLVGDNREEIGGTVIGETINGICPPHPGFIKEMCILCGHKQEDDGSAVPLSYIHKDLKLDSKEIERLRGVDLKNLLREKKLILILDLDHTLLNSTRLIDVTPEEEYLLRQADQTQGDPNRCLFKLGHIHMLTKLRPFVRTFLEEASIKFEMYVYTMAERSYALEVAKLLDPQRKYFDSKVISQSESTQRHQKGLDVVLGAEASVVILDDTESVWSRHKENLILMERYHYFASSCRQFNFNANSLSESKKDEREADGALATILSILKRAHQLFFDPDLDTDISSRDVRQVLKKIRAEVLQGCTIAFSRVYTTDLVAEIQPIWKMAERLGAKCSRDVDSSVTHVVSNDIGTHKSRWALKNEKFLVNPGWIEAANYLWVRQREEDYRVSRPKDTKD